MEYLPLAKTRTDRFDTTINETPRNEIGALYIKPQLNTFDTPVMLDHVDSSIRYSRPESRAISPIQVDLSGTKRRNSVRKRTTAKPKPAPISLEKKTTKTFNKDMSTGTDFSPYIISDNLTST